MLTPFPSLTLLFALVLLTCSKTHLDVITVICVCTPGATSEKGLIFVGLMSLISIMYS